MTNPMSTLLVLFLTTDLVTRTEMKTFNSSNISRTQFVVDGQIELDCPIRSRHEPADTFSVVFWFRGERGQHSFVTVDNRRSSHLLNSPKSPNHQSVVITYAPFTTTNHESPVNQTRIRASVYHNQAIVRLVIDRAQLSDQGLFHCRVDFARSRTEWHFFWVQLIVPPKKLILLDITRNETTIRSDKIEPFEEETENVTLVCETLFVKPVPKVLWFEGNTLIDDSYEIIQTQQLTQSNWNSLSSSPSVRHRRRHQPNLSREQSPLTNLSFTNLDTDDPLVRVRNQLVIVGKLTRRDLYRTFRCVAFNTELTSPAEEAITLDILLRPISVEIIIGSPDAFLEGHNVGLICHSYGAVPVAQLSWYKNGIEMNGAQGRFDYSKNLSISIIRWVARNTDHRAEITCQARNVRLKDSELATLRDSVILDVKFMPLVSLHQINATLLDNQTDLLVPNTTVRLFCSIWANPPVMLTVDKDIVWFHNDSRLSVSQGQMQGISMKNNTLEVTSLSHLFHDGNYSCYAQNKLGARMSNSVSISVAYPPVCALHQPIEYGMGVNDLVPISCDIDARPSMAQFTWTVNGTHDVGHMRYNPRGTQSVLYYTPKNRDSYGYVQCTAKNQMGEMIVPCRFRVFARGRPEPVRSCSVRQHIELDQPSADTEVEPSNSTSQSVSIRCKFHYNGGGQTRCWVQIFGTDDSLLVWSGVSEPLTEVELNVPEHNVDCRLRPSLVVTSTTRFRLVVMAFNEVGNASHSFENVIRIDPSTPTTDQTEHPTFRHTQWRTTDHQQHSPRPKEGGTFDLTNGATIVVNDVLSGGNSLLVLTIVCLSVAFLWLVCTVKNVLVQREQRSQRTACRLSRHNDLANAGDLQQMTTFLNQPSADRSLSSPESTLLTHDYWSSAYGIAQADVVIFPQNHSDQCCRSSPSRASFGVTTSGGSTVATSSTASLHSMPTMNATTETTTGAQSSVSVHSSFLSVPLVTEHRPNQCKCQAIELTTFKVANVDYQSLSTDKKDDTRSLFGSLNDGRCRFKRKRTCCQHRLHRLVNDKCNKQLLIEPVDPN